MNEIKKQFVILVSIIFGLLLTAVAFIAFFPAKEEPLTVCNCPNTQACWTYGKYTNLWEEFLVWKENKAPVEELQQVELYYNLSDNETILYHEEGVYDEGWEVLDV
jgi:hypothetical protein